MNSDPLPVFRSTKHTTTTKDAKSALLVLLQHNCLKIIPRNLVPTSGPTQVAAGFKKIDRDQTQYGNLYSLDIDMVINRLRYGRLLICIKQKFSDVGVAIISELAYYGRQKFKDIVSNVVQIFLNNNDDIDDDSDRKSDIIRQIEVEVINNLREMIRTRYIVRVRSFGYNYAIGPEPEAPAQTYEGNFIYYITYSIN